MYLRLSLFDSLFQILCANPGCRHQFMSRRAPSFGDGMYGLQNVGQNVGSDDSDDETNSNLSGNDNDQHEDDNPIPDPGDKDADDPRVQQPTSVGVLQLLTEFTEGENFADLDKQLLTQKEQQLVSDVTNQPWTRKLVWSAWFGGRNQTILISGSEVPSDQKWFQLAAKAHSIIMAARQAKRPISTPALFEVCYTNIVLHKSVRVDRKSTNHQLWSIFSSSTLFLLLREC